MTGPGNLMSSNEKSAREGEPSGPNTGVSAEKRAATALAQLTSIGSQRGMPLRDKAHAILQLGCDTFELPFGIVSCIEGERYTLVYAVSPGDELVPGTSFDLGETYCVHTLKADAPTGFEHAGESDIRDHPCYHTFKLESYLGAPLMVDGERYGTLNFSSPQVRERPFSESDRELVRLFAQWVGFELARERDLEALEHARSELERLATTDDLTQLLNRRALLSFGRNELHRARRLDHALCVLLIDVDHFKPVNDSYGHAVGDMVLKGVAQACRASVREVDGVGRVGGDEFCVLLLHTRRMTGAVIAERIRKNVSQHQAEAGEGHVSVSVSIGVAELATANESFEALLARADAALYEAKRGGRDRISVDNG